MVFIPDGRLLCHFCTRTAAANPIIKIGCPLCGGVLNEPGHYESSRHFQRVGHDRSTMASIASRPR